MKLYTIRQYEIIEQMYLVRADSEEEAYRKFNDGEYTPHGTEFVQPYGDAEIYDVEVY